MRRLPLLAILPGLLLAQPNRTACSLSPEVEAAYHALPLMSDLSRSWEERMGPRRALAAKHPANWPLQVFLQDAIRHQFQMGREWDQAIDHYRALSDRTLGELLEARLLSPLHRKRSREMLDHVLSQAPDSPWIHLVLMEWATFRGGDASLAEREFEEFRRLCPASPRPFVIFDFVSDPDKQYSHIQALRGILETKKKGGLEEEDLSLFRLAWRWERILYGDDRAEEFRRLVRSDLEALRANPHYDWQRWYALVRQGYEDTLKDKAAAGSLEKEILDRAPTSAAAYGIVRDQWRLQNPQPELPSRAESEAYRKSEEAASLERLRRFWGKPYAVFEALRLLRSPSSILPREEFERVADFLLSMRERFPDQGAGVPPYQILVAEAYVSRKTRLEQVPSLVDRGLEQIECQEKYRRDADALQDLPGRRDNVAITQERAREILIRHAIATGETERAELLLGDMRRELEQTKPPDTATRLTGEWAHRQSTYLRLAKEAGQDPSPLAEPVPPSPEQAARHPVKEFTAKDLSGKTWRLADLKGKVAYVNIWTTWCAPCRAEMPGLQKLYERWKDRPDRVVLTISADLHPMLAESFLQENGYSFPVIWGREAAESFFPAVFFPQNWLIDPQGCRMDFPAPRAFDTTLAQIEDLAARIAAAPSAPAEAPAPR